MTPNCLGLPMQVVTDLSSAYLDLAGPGSALVGLWPWPGLAIIYRTMALVGPGLTLAIQGRLTRLAKVSSLLPTLVGRGPDLVLA